MNLSVMIKKEYVIYPLLLINIDVNEISNLDMIDWNNFKSEKENDDDYHKKTV